MHPEPRYSKQALRVRVESPPTNTSAANPVEKFDRSRPRVQKKRQKSALLESGSLPIGCLVVLVPSLRS